MSEGVLLSILIINHFSIVNFWQCLGLVLWGTLSSVIIDIDFLIYKKRVGKIDEFAHEHRDIARKPLLIIAGGVLLNLWHPAIGWIWGLATFAHFLHDIVNEGWGIRWLWPLPIVGDWYFTLASYSPRKVINGLEEQRRIARDYGDSHWFQRQSSFNRETVIKLSVFLLILFLVVVIMCLKL